MSTLVSVFAVLAVWLLVPETAVAQLYGTSKPPSTSTSFFGSGPFTVCEFDRRDRPADPVDVTVELKNFIPPPSFDVGHVSRGEVHLGGVAVCGLPESSNRLVNFAFFDVDVTFGCVTRTVLSNGTIEYKESLGDCQEQQLVLGRFTGRSSPLPVGVIDGLLEECAVQSDVGSCVLEVGVPVGVQPTFFRKKVCPKQPGVGLTADGQIFAFTETRNPATGEVRPGTIGACYCDSDLDGGDVTCGAANAPEPQQANTAGALDCEFDWRKSIDTINSAGSPNQVPAAIYDAPACPVADIVTSSVRVCNDVRPRSFKLQTVQGRAALTFQIHEGDCAASFSDLPIGAVAEIPVEGEMNDGTRFEGFDDVIVQ